MPSTGDVALQYYDGTRYRTDIELAATPALTYTPAAGLMVARTGGKLGFLGATPAVKPTHVDQAVAVYVTQTVTNPPSQAEVQAINDGLVTAVRLVNRLRTDLMALGLITGS